MRCRAVAAVLLTFGAGCESEPVDPLDPELIHELAIERGTASGDARSGSYDFALAVDTCDCPTFDYQGQPFDLCQLREVGNIHAELTESDGALVMTSAFGLFTGAIEADGSFVVTGVEDLSTAAGPLEWLHRIDGQFSSDDSAAGWLGQRLIGEVPGQRIDCRWIGSFALTRN